MIQSRGGNQGNQSIIDLTEDDVTEFLYFCKTEGNNSRRMKRRMASISAFYKFLRKKKLITENPMEFMDRPKKDRPFRQRVRNITGRRGRRPLHLLPTTTRFCGQYIW